MLLGKVLIVVVLAVLAVHCLGVPHWAMFMACIVAGYFISKSAHS